VGQHSSKLFAPSDQTPFFTYAGSNAPEHKTETIQHRGQGSTNNAQGLFQLVTRSILGRAPSTNG